MKDLEEQMNHSLHRRVDGLDEAPFSLADVQGRAWSIRRRRRIAAAAVAAVAVVAVGVPVGLGLGGGSSTEQPAPAGPSVTDDPDPTGTGPGFGYLVGSTFTYPDGTTLELPSADYTAVAPLGDTLAAYHLLDDETGEAAIDRIDATGRVTESVPTSEQFTVAAGGDAIAFVNADAQLEAWYDDQAEVLASAESGDLPSAPMVTDVVGDDCAEMGPNCGIYLVSGDSDGPPVVFSRADGVSEVPLAQGSSLAGVSGEGLLSVNRYDGGDGNCAGIVHPVSGAEPWENCEVSVGGFSPGNSHLTALLPYYDGPVALPFVAILDAADGTELSRFDAVDGGYLSGRTVWEDDDHLLAEVYDGSAWSVVRLGVDGTHETVVDPVPALSEQDGGDGFGGPSPITLAGASS